MKKADLILVFIVIAVCLLFAFIRLNSNEFQTFAQTDTAKNADYENNSAEAKISDKTDNVGKIEQCDFSNYKTLKTRSLKVEKLPQPKYPAEAQEKKISGCVPVKILVNQTGTVIESCVVRNKDSEKICSDRINNDLFENLSKEAAIKAKFDVKSLKLGDKEYFETVIVYRFTLPKSLR